MTVTRKMMRSNKTTWIEYLNRSTIHGLPYFKPEKSRTSKLVWLVAVVVGGLFCFQLVYFILIRYQTNFTETNLKLNAFPVWEDPFPGVSICNYNIVYKKHTANVTDTL